MAWKAALAVFGLFLLSSCDDIRGIEICVINEDGERLIGKCSDGDRNFDRPIEQLRDWYCVSETDFRKVAAKLDECERRDP